MDIKGRRKVAKGPYKELVAESLSLLKRGWTREKITKKIIEDTGLAYETVYSGILTNACKILADEHISKGEQFIGLHLDRYNRDIEYLLDRDYSHFDDHSKALSAKIADKFELIQLLVQKEKFLQLHSKITVVKIQNSKKKPQKVNLFKLSDSSMIKLLTVIDKLKGNSLESVVITSKFSEEYIQEAEVIEEIPNITKIQTLQIEEKSEEEQTDTNKVSTFENVTNKIRLALLKKAEEEFNRIKQK